MTSTTITGSLWCINWIVWEYSCKRHVTCCKRNFLPSIQAFSPSLMGLSNNLKRTFGTQCSGLECTLLLSQGYCWEWLLCLLLRALTVWSPAITLLVMMPSFTFLVATCVEAHCVVVKFHSRHIFICVRWEEWQLKYVLHYNHFDKMVIWWGHLTFPCVVAAFSLNVQTRLWHVLWSLPLFYISPNQRSMNLVLLFSPMGLQISLQHWFYHDNNSNPMW